MTGAVDASGATETLCLGTDSFTTRPTDTPPDREFKSRLLDPGAIAMSIYSGGGGAIAGGAARLDIGEIVATNIDGEFDRLKGWSFDGREIVMRAPAKPGVLGEYPASFPAILVATMQSVEVGWDELIINVRDQTYIFEKAVQTLRFQGTNQPGDAGLEGTADDIKDQLKPLLFGRVPNFAPPCCNPGKQTYRVSLGPVDDISAVYVRGAPQTRGQDHATSALLQAASVPQGTYQTCLAEGLFRIGSAGTDGQVTCDAAEGAVEGRSAARLLRRLALMAGVPESAISAEDVMALDVLNPATLGRWLDNEETSFLDLMEEAARSIGAWFGFDPTGKLRMGRLDAPKGQPMATLHKWQIITDGMRRTVLQEVPAPLWSVTINHTPIGQTQDTDLVGTVSAERRAFLRTKYRSATSAEDAVKTQFRLAGSLTIDTLLMDAAPAELEAQRKRQLHDGPQDVYEIPVPMDEAAKLIQRGVWLGRELAVDVDRFSLEGGKSFVVIGINIQRRAQQVVFRLWGEAKTSGPNYADTEGYAFGSGRAAAIGQNATGPVDVVGAASGRGSANAVGEAVIPGEDDAGEPVGVFPLTITKNE